MAKRGPAAIMNRPTGLADLGPPPYPPARGPAYSVCIPAEQFVGPKAVENHRRPQSGRYELQKGGPIGSPIILVAVLSGIPSRANRPGGGRAGGRGGIRDERGGAAARG